MLVTAMLVITIQLTAMFAGFAMFGYFYKKGCDPLSTGEISSPNQVYNIHNKKIQIQDDNDNVIDES